MFVCAEECLHADRLVSPEILDLVHRGARMVYVGKQKGMHTRTQEEIHDLLHQWASDVPLVVRLKGGDPFIFGRGGEEAEYLRRRGVQVQSIPGKQGRYNYALLTQSLLRQS